MEEQYIGNVTQQLGNAAIEQQAKEKMIDYLNNRVIDLQQQIEAISRHLDIQLSRAGGYHAWKMPRGIEKPKKWWEFWK